ncbi:MAG: hypothetical protein ACK5FE_14335 [Cyanobacteriota bacterium]
MVAAGSIHHRWQWAEQLHRVADGAPVAVAGAHLKADGGLAGIRIESRQPADGLPDGLLDRFVATIKAAQGLDGCGPTDLQYLVAKSPASSALGLVIRGTKVVSETHSPQGALTYTLDKKRCVAFLSANKTYEAITFADDSKCQR